MLLALSGVRLIQGLLKRLSRSQALAVLTNVATSSAQRLRILLFYFLRFVAKILNLSKHNRDSKSSDSAPESYTILTSASSGWCSHADAPLPPHNWHTAVNRTQDIVSPSPARSITIPDPRTPQQAIPPRIVLHAEVSIDGARFDVNFTTFLPKGISRYGKYFADRTPDYPSIPALTREFPMKLYPWLNGAPGWQSYIHPRGARYLYNNNRRTFTEVNIGDNAFRFQVVDACMDALWRLCPELVNPEDDNVELVLQLTGLKDSDAFCQYYFVDHAKRTLFWLQDYVQVTEEIFGGLRGVHDPSHAAYALEYQYWDHCDYFPNHEQDRGKLLKELRDLVVYARADMMSSEMSLSWFSNDDLSSILELINHLEVNIEDDSLHSVCVIAGFMGVFSRSKFLNFCGMPCARRNADTSVFEPDDTSPFYLLTSSLSFVFDSIFFWAHQAHYDQLQRVFMDKAIIRRRWRDFSKNLIAEWTGITTYVRIIMVNILFERRILTYDLILRKSTIMLVVDVTFLAVPNVNIQQSHSVGVIAIYVSTIFITGSLIISLLLARQTQRYGLEPVTAVRRLLLNTTGSVFGMRALAVIHSLPFTMLLWGMIFFAIAFLYNVFKSTTVAVLASVVSGCMVITIFILWFVWVAREVDIFSRLAKLIKDRRTRQNS